MRDLRKSSLFVEAVLVLVRKFECFEMAESRGTLLAVFAPFASCRSTDPRDTFFERQSGDREATDVLYPENHLIFGPV